MKTKLQSDGTIMPRSSAAIGCAVATFDLEFPNLQKCSYEYKKLSITSELENNANILIEFERKGFLTRDEVSRMIEVSTRNIISNNMPGVLFENVSMMVDDEVLKNIKNKLIEIERKGFLTHDEVLRIVKVLNQNIMHKIMSRPLFKYVCILMDDENCDYSDPIPNIP